jgi:hypothetical protein
VKKILLVGLIAVAVTGCATNPTARGDNPNQGSYAKMIALGFFCPDCAGEEAVKLGLAKSPFQRAQENCQSLGHRPNTTGHQQCVHQQLHAHAVTRSQEIDVVCNHDYNKIMNTVTTRCRSR